MRKRALFIALTVSAFLAVNMAPALAIYRPGH
jgi:hypothetical protein